jgi:phosphohistidine phosphatase SixA
VLVGVVLLTGCLAAPEPQGPLTGQALVDALRDGGHVLYLRHTETTRGGVDDLATLGDCTRQRPLSDAGRRDAREIGVAFDELGIPVGDVLASPFCRTVETARLAFGDVEADEGLLALAPDGSNREATADRVRALLADEPDDGENTVLVGHVSNLALVTSYEPEEGGTIVLRPDGERWTLVGEVPPQGWQRLAERYS